MGWRREHKSSQEERKKVRDLQRGSSNSSRKTENKFSIALCCSYQILDACERWSLVSNIHWILVVAASCRESVTDGHRRRFKGHCRFRAERREAREVISSQEEKGLSFPSCPYWLRRINVFLTKHTVCTGLYMVARNIFLLLLNCSAWPCLGPP